MITHINICTLEEEGGQQRLGGPDVVSLVILVPVQPLLVELDNDLRSIMFFMFFNNGFNFARDLTITQIHG